jgi:hypothetical protein
MSSPGGAPGPGNAGFINTVSGGAAPTAPAPSAAPQQRVVKQTGKILDYATGDGVSGARVELNDSIAWTDSSGAYTLEVPPGQPFPLVASAPKYLTLIEQPSSSTVDVDRGVTKMAASPLTTLLGRGLEGYDDKLGILSVELIPIGACKSVAGTKVHLRGDSGAAKTSYFRSNLPSLSTAAALDRELPTAVIYNVPIGKQLSVATEGGSCAQAPFPVDYNNIRWEGTVTAQPGDATTFVRVFMQ